MPPQITAPSLPRIRPGGQERESRELQGDWISACAGMTEKLLCSYYYSLSSFDGFTDNLYKQNKYHRNFPNDMRTKAAAVQALWILSTHADHYIG